VDLDSGWRPVRRPSSAQPLRLAIYRQTAGQSRPTWWSPTFAERPAGAEL